MNEISQVAKDAIAIIGACLLFILLLGLGAYCIYLMAKYEVPERQKKIKKLELEIKKLNQDIENFELKKAFMKAQKDLMEQRSK